jgi:hypothetical protein
VADAQEARERCLQCLRPAAQCYCDHLIRVANRTPVVIVQHPHEQFHPFGTARMVRRCFERAQVHVDYDRTLRDERRALPLPKGAALLYPGPDARDLATLEPEERPSALVVIDATWGQARGLYRDLAPLQALPKVSFDATQPSRYRIRKQPRLECLSTVEAVVRALELLEPDLAGLDRVLDAFAAMIDLQISTAKARPRAPRQARRRRPRRTGLPAWLTDETDRHVLVYGEAAFVGPEAERATGRALAALPKTLIQWTALRPGTGECFSRLIRPPYLPLERRLCPTGLEASDLESANELGEARDAWRTWLRDDDRLLCWNKSTLDIMDALDTPREAHCLKGEYKNFAHRRDPKAWLGGSIDAVVESEGLRVNPVAVPGRAARRLAELEAVSRLLIEGATAALEPGVRSDHHSCGGDSAASLVSNVATA